MITHNIPLPSLKQIAAGLAPFGVVMNETQLGAIAKYVGHLLLWNQNVSLTSIADPMEIVTRHFGESIFCGNSADMRIGRLADVGTGAGFPGLPIKIVSPDLDLTLIEPNLKKCAFLAEVVSLLGLRGVQIIRRPYAEVGAEMGEVDFVCSRALGNYKALARWACTQMRPGGKLVLLLGLEDSIKIATNSDFVWGPPTRIPDSRQRLVLLGQKK